MAFIEHSTETRSIRVGKGDGWIAVCQGHGCNWEGPSRRKRDAAEDDASAHHLAMYPDDEPGSAMR